MVEVVYGSVQKHTGPCNLNVTSCALSTNQRSTPRPKVSLAKVLCEECAKRCLWLERWKVKENNGLGRWAALDCGGFLFHR